MRSATKRSEPSGVRFGRARTELLARPALHGAAFARAYCDVVDAWLRSLVPDRDDLALVAVGGYGRRELAPGSDVDVVLVHRHSSASIERIADEIWYPIWDSGLRLDHSVRTASQCLDAARHDVRVALGLLDARLIAGDPGLCGRVRARGARVWSRHHRRWLAELGEQARARQDDLGPVAFALEPHLKEGAGGLRDFTLLRALSRLTPGGQPDPAARRAGGLLFAARVEVQRCADIREERLLLDYQDDVAAMLTCRDADALMHDVAASARTITWHLDATTRTLRRPRRATRSRGAPIGAGIVRFGDELALAPDARPGRDASLLVRVAERAAAERLPIAPDALRRLADSAPAMDQTWSLEARDALVRLLGSGESAVRVFEELDQHDLVARLLPEWARVRSRPQRNAFHRYTVDRHLIETAARAAPLAGTVERPDLLLVAAWLHDLGKGTPGDHSEAGIVLMRGIATRLGYDPEDVETLVGLVRWHLLLPAVATSRDLDDPRTIEDVATTVGDRAVLELLHALTQADSEATGPAAWTPWKAELVAQLTDRVARALEGQPHVGSSATPGADAALVRRAQGRLLVEGTGQHLVVAAADEPGLLTHVVGLLALRGCDVRSARARPAGRFAISEFDLTPTERTAPDWTGFGAQLTRALAREVDLDSAIAERTKTLGILRRPRAARATPPRVLVDNEASPRATVVEVRSADELGVLFRITRAIAALGLDIRHAMVSTLGPEVVDTFYVLGQDGEKVTEPSPVQRIEGSLLAAVGAP